MQPIFTLNSRSHVMLEVMRDHFGLEATRMKREIQTLHSHAIEILSAKGIPYASLRPALVPAMDRHEAMFIFDSQETGSSLYGRDVFNHLLPLLDLRTTQSILVGDLLGEDQSVIIEILRESMILARSFTFKHATLLYGVYINNLSDAVLTKLHGELGAFGAYLGYIPTNFHSQAKVYASTTMTGFLLKRGNTLIMAHEDDRPNTEDINITLYELEQFGYRVASLQSTYFSIFLTYKIERPVFKGDEIDGEIALNAISDRVLPLRGFTVLLDEAKHGYLINKKLGKLQQAGLATADRLQIEAIIHAKVSSNYIYQLTYLEEHNVMKFNIMLEMGLADGYPSRLTAALEYMPEQQLLRVITLH